jgi:hypothetical protein
MRELSAKGAIMFFKGKRKPAILRVLAAVLGVFLVAVGGTSTLGLSPTMLPTEMALAANPAPDSTCQAVLDATEKLFTTPFHMYSTTAFAGVGNGKTVSGEMVFAGGARYVLYNGKWNPSPISTEEMKAQEQRNLKNTTNVSCHLVRDESVNGESATLYSMHSETPRSKNDDQVWISKSKGLILRQETDLYSKGGNRKTHVSARYEYSNVQVPRL